MKQKWIASLPDNMKITDKTKAQCRQIRLPAIAENAAESVQRADRKKITYLEFLSELLGTEIGQRMEKEKNAEKRMPGYRSAITWTYITMAAKTVWESRN